MGRLYVYLPLCYHQNLLEELFELYILLILDISMATTLFPIKHVYFSFGGCSRAVWDHISRTGIIFTNITYQASSWLTLLRDFWRDQDHSRSRDLYWLSTTMTIPSKKLAISLGWVPARDPIHPWMTSRDHPKVTIPTTSKGKVGYPWESTRDIYQHIPPIYRFYNGCIGQYGVMFGEQLLGYPPKDTKYFPTGRLLTVEGRMKGTASAKTWSTLVTTLQGVMAGQPGPPLNDDVPPVFWNKGLMRC